MVITTTPLPNLHRDGLNRVIRCGDHVVWTNRKQGKGFSICRVVGSTEETVRLSTIDGRLTNVQPFNVIVITAQIERNIEGNVGANIDLEESRRIRSDNT